MIAVHEFKKRTELETPLLLFECRLRDGSVERWSTHTAVVDGKHYAPRVVKHNAFELRLASDDGIDTAGRMVVTLANTDSRFSQIERSIGFKGARLTVRFAFYGVDQQSTLSEAVAVFLGTANPPEEITEKTVRLSFMNRLSLQRVVLPAARIQARCPWMFPSTLEQRIEAADSGPLGPYSRFHSCGYSADREGGCGNLSDGQPFTACGYTKRDCEARGMFKEDAQGRATARFGGFQFLPPNIGVRTNGEKGSHVVESFDGRGRANDAIPLVYGTTWYQPSMVFSRNDGNLTHCEVLLGSGPIETVHKVLVNGVEIPIGITGRDMGGTGWYNVVSDGGRNGSFNLNFTDKAGQVLGDPHGGMAVLAVAVPNRVYDGRGSAKVEVLVDGLRLERFNTQGDSLGVAFTKNPAWILLDVLRRSGWRVEELSVASFAMAAAYCDELIPAKDIHANDIQLPRFECNLALTQRRSAAEIVRGIRTSSALMLTFDSSGRLELTPEAGLRVQQGEPRESSNAIEPLDGGWPSYEFGDGLNGTGAILRDSSGEPRIRLWSKGTGESPNRISVEFQNALNEYQQDSVSLADLDDVLTVGQELSVMLPALGMPHSDQAMRVVRFHLIKTQHGNSYVEFETSVQALGLRPGDIVTLTYLKEGLDRAPFRILKLTPSENYETVRLVAQRHVDAWYELLSGADPDSIDRQRQTGRYGHLPRPLAGRRITETGDQEFDVEEVAIPQSDGTLAVQLKVGFNPPAVPEVSSAGIPIVGLSPQVINTDGTLKGGQTLYYAISAVDANGSESDLSFTVRATIPAGPATNSVKLHGISVHSDAAAFRVYRGETPNALLLIAANVPRGATFVDSGHAAAPVPPPDPNYDHANFHWRHELMPEVGATFFGPATIGNGALSMLPNEYRGSVVRLTAGFGAGQERVILSNDATTFLLATAWNIVPDATSRFTVAEASWKFGAATRSDEAQFEVPNRSEAFIQISGRAANSLDVETPAEISVLHRHRIGGGAGGSVDADVPAAPTFGLSVSGRGQVELVGIGFEDLSNTKTVSAGTLTLHHWNELTGATQYRLASPLTAGGEWLTLDAPGTAVENDLVQVGDELMKVLEVQAGGSIYRVARGACASFPADHVADESVWHLSRHVVVAPFPPDFFGTPASGAYLHTIPMRNVRIAGAEFFVTNMRGDSPTSYASFTWLLDQGLRTLAGGQYSVQVLGEPALETSVAPPLVVDETRSVGDVFATLAEPPVGGAVTLRLRLDGTVMCDLEIPSGSRASDAVSGIMLPVLQAGSEIAVDVIGVPQGAASRPGKHLSVTMRL